MKKLIIFFGIGFFILLATACKDNSTSKETVQIPTQISKADKIEIVDFHSSRRCYSCETIEEYTRKTLEKHFKKELDSGKIVFKSINGELSENQEIVTKYQARGSSLFINAIKDGKENIEEDIQVWRLVSDQQKFEEYLKTKINIILN